MIHTIAFRSIDLSFWDTLYKRGSARVAPTEKYRRILSLRGKIVKVSGKRHVTAIRRRGAYADLRGTINLYSAERKKTRPRTAIRKMRDVEVSSASSLSLLSENSTRFQFRQRTTSLWKIASLRRFEIAQFTFPVNAQNTLYFQNCRYVKLSNMSNCQIRQSVKLSNLSAYWSRYHCVRNIQNVLLIQIDAK